MEVQRLADNARAYLSTDTGKREWTERRRKGLNDTQNWALTVIMAEKGKTLTGESVEAAVALIQGRGCK